MNATPGKLTVESDGRLKGAAVLEYNNPFPVANGSWGSGAMNGVVMHTSVSTFQSCVSWFNNSSAQASAHFCIGTDGTIHQFGPIGKGWIAWAEMAGNSSWYSIEHVDNGNPRTPLTPAQITASAQVVECLSAFAGFPLQEANSPSEHGYGVHYMGGAAWGGHTCPDTDPQHPVRSQQRPAILALAKQIRAGTPVPPVPPPVPFPSGLYQADGHTSLAGLSALQANDETSILNETFTQLGLLSKPAGPLERRYINAGNWQALMPSGMVLWLP